MLCLMCGTVCEKLYDSPTIGTWVRGGLALQLSVVVVNGEWWVVSGAEDDRAVELLVTCCAEYSL